MARKIANWRNFIARELMVALGVLALVFLSFSHQPVNAQKANGVYVFADGSAAVFCGSAPNNGTGSSSDKSCDICRIATGIALPETYADCSDQFALVARTSVPGFDFPLLSGLIDQISCSRAPPFA